MFTLLKIFVISACSIYKIPEKGEKLLSNLARLDLNLSYSHHKHTLGTTELCNICDEIFFHVSKWRFPIP